MIHLLVKCVVPKYDVKIQFYGLGDIGAYPEINSSQIKDEQWLLVIYDSTDIIHYQQIPILSIWSFVSSAGGSLGLFLGFSFYSILSHCYDYIKGRLESSSRVYMIRQDGLEHGEEIRNGDATTVARF